jgi:hypothetical protein
MIIPIFFQLIIFLLDYKFFFVEAYKGAHKIIGAT